MVQRAISMRALAVALSFLAVIMTVPFSPAEALSAFPLGAVVTPGNVTVGNTAAPTGTTIFAGDRVASDGSALINLNSGSRIEMTKAAATFDRQGNTLVVQAKEGLLRFNFIKGEKVQINAGKYAFASANDSAHVGELGLDRNGQIVMNVTEGVFTTLNTATGVRSEASPNRPVVMMDQAGKSAGATASAGAAAAEDAAAGMKTGMFIGPILAIVIAVGAMSAGIGVAVYESTKSP
jgi:hypothetical protein